MNKHHTPDLKAEKTEGGVHSSVTPTMPSATYRQIVFAPNFTASTVIVLVEDFDGTQTPIHTITGLPAGTWFPAESGSARIFTFTHNPAGPAGFLTIIHTTRR